MDTNRIQHLISKIYTILTNKETKSGIDLDLMLDYTRVMYADLLDLKKEFDNTAHIASIPPFSENQVQEKLPIDNQHLDIPTASEEKSNASNYVGIVMEIPTPASAPIEPQKDVADVINDNLISENSVDIPIEIPNSFDNEKLDAVKPSKEGLKDTVNSPAERKEVRKLIGINDKYLFMNELFNNDKFDYESVLDYINQANDLQTVNAWLNKEYLEIGKWNKEDATVDLFYGVVNKYFSNFK